MKTLRLTLALTLLLVPSLLPIPAHAGGNLGAFDITAGAPGPVPGSLAVEIAERKWDPRCLPVRYVLRGDTPANISLDDLAAEFQASMDRWNAIPTSFVDFQFDRVEAQPAVGAAFDMVNELSFLGNFFGAVSPSVALVQDSQFTPGLDLDLDGDSDVFDPTDPQDPGFGIEVCTDVDGDGDHEFPAGFYRAGTMLDDDILFGAPQIVPWVLDPTTPTGGVDLQAIAVHELGHSHGLSHSPLNQTSATDGDGATMFPFFDSGDPVDQLSQRSPAVDDIAWSSFFHPEGSAATGAAALQAGDVAFEDVYTVVTGEVTHGATGQPLAGGTIQAESRFGGEAAVVTFTGTGRYYLSAGGSLVLDPAFQDFHIVDGSYRLPLPDGEYHFRIEAMDNHPVSDLRFNDTVFIGGEFGQDDFNEEIFSKKDPEKGLKEIKVKTKTVQPPPVVDYTTAADGELAPFDRIGFDPETDFDGIGFILPPGFWYATRFPASEVQAVIDGDQVFKGASFFTFILDASFVPTFATAALVTGSVNADGTVATLDLDDPLIIEAPFVAQPSDDSPFFFPEPRKTTKNIEKAIEDGATDFFLVLQLSDAVSTPSGFPPFVGLDSGQEAGLLGRSYFSFDGAQFSQFPPWNWMFRLIFAPAS